MSFPATENADVVIDGGRGGPLRFTPMRVKARRWLEKNTVSDGYQWIGGGLVVEFRMAFDIAEALLAAGFTLGNP